MLGPVGQHLCPHLWISVVAAQLNTDRWFRGEVPRPSPSGVPRGVKTEWLSWAPLEAAVKRLREYANFLESMPIDVDKHEAAILRLHSKNPEDFATTEDAAPRDSARAEVINRRDKEDFSTQHPPS